MGAAAVSAAPSRQSKAYATTVMVAGVTMLTTKGTRMSIDVWATNMVPRTAMWEIRAV